MLEKVQLQEEAKSAKSASSETMTVQGLEVCQVEKRGWLKGWLPMAICCGMPLVLLAVISLFGASLAAIAGGLLSLAVVLACPLGMYLMMRMMMNKR